MTRTSLACAGPCSAQRRPSHDGPRPQARHHPLLRRSLAVTAPDQMSPLRRKLYDVIFGTDTPAGKNFDLILIAAILLSVAAILVDSIPSVHLRFKDPLKWVEWSFTLMFTVEYLVRIYCSPNPRRYI